MTLLQLIPAGLVVALASAQFEPCRITVVDEENGWPVPLVELRTTGNSSFWTDNAGVVAFDLPECMGTETWIEIFSHGYEVPADGFGNRGVRLIPKQGGDLKIEVKRTQVAKRLGRLTGAGMFAEAQRFGDFPNWSESGVTGSDTVQMVEYQDKLFWLWGDTNLPGYPLGIFETSGAWSKLKPLSDPKPPMAIHYDYFRSESGKPRAISPIEGKGPTWLSGLIVLPDKTGRDRLVATYAKIPEHLDPGEMGLVEWDDSAEIFKPVMKFWERGESEKPEKPFPDGHAVIAKDEAGTEWLYMNGPPDFKCRPTYEAWKNPSEWLRVDQPRSFKTVGGGGEIEVSTASIAWSEYRKRWVMIVQQKFGKPSVFGEVWYLEGATPEGPWGPAVKIATHENYTFYNVQIDWQLTRPEDSFILFEGTYTHTFTDNQKKTPRYEYNQMLYRLDLDDPALSGARME